MSAHRERQHPMGADMTKHTTKIEILAKEILKLVRWAKVRVPRLTAITIAARESGLQATQTEWLAAIALLVERKKLLRSSDTWLVAA